MPGHAGRGPEHVRHNSQGRLRAGPDGPPGEIPPHGGRHDRRYEAHIAHVGPGRVHDVHAADLRYIERRAGAGQHVQPVDVQLPVVHARRAAHQTVVGVRVPAAVELQHDVLRVDQHQVPVRRGDQIRNASVSPCSQRPASGRRRRLPLTASS